MKLVMHVYDDETGDEIEERELELKDIGEVSQAIDDVELREGQSLKADWNAGKDFKKRPGFLKGLIGG